MFLGLQCVCLLLSTSFPQCEAPADECEFSAGQGEVVGCGEVCVRLLCEWYGVPFQRESVLNRLKPGDFGEASLANLQETLESQGFPCRAVRGGIEDLASWKHPMILVGGRGKVAAKGQPGHFLLARYDEKTNQLLGYDLAAGPAPFSITSDTLEQVWTGVALLVEPPSLVVDRGKGSLSERLWYICGALLGTVVGLVCAAWERRRGLEVC